VATGNAEVGFIPPPALVKRSEGSYSKSVTSYTGQSNQALGIIKESTKQDAARKFVDFLLSPEGRELMSQKGYRMR